MAKRTVILSVLLVVWGCASDPRATEQTSSGLTHSEVDDLEALGVRGHLGGVNRIAEIFENRTAPTVRIVSNVLDPAQSAARRAARSHNRVTAPESLARFLDTQRDDAMVELTLELPAVAGAEVGAALSDADRRMAISRAESLTNAAQASTIERVRAAGGRVLASRWLANQLDVLVPVPWARGVVQRSEFVAVSRNSDVGGAGVGYDGIEGRSATLASTLHSSSFRGQSGGRAGGRIRLGIIEWNDSGNNIVDRTHPAFLRGGTSRFISVWDCTSGNCVADSAGAFSGSNQHGTRVSWVAAGSIEAGQDPAFPGSGTVPQRARSGIAPESDIYYYRVSSCAGVASAIQRAVADGVDVANFSAWTSSRNCATTLDCGGINSAIRAAADAGMPFVACAGNGTPAPPSCIGGNCNLWYPGIRPEALSVNGMVVESTTSPFPTRPYMSSPLGMTVGGGCISSQGGMTIQTRGGTVSVAAGVALSAPGVWNNLAEFPGGYHGSNPSGVTGCSFATPAVAASTGLLRQAINAIGWDASDARLLFVNMLLQGDNWANPSTEDMPSGISSQSGYGRLRTHYPSNDSLTAPWGWGYWSFVIQQGQTVEWQVWDAGPENPSITQWKWAFTWFDPDLNATSDIVIEVRNGCPAPGNPIVIREDYSFDSRKGLRLWGSSISGRCLVMRAHAYETPSGGTRVYTADYFHSGDPTTH
jgi:Subtilase family